MLKNFTSKILKSSGAFIETGRQQVDHGLDELRTQWWPIIWNGWVRPTASLLMLIRFATSSSALSCLPTHRWPHKKWLAHRFGKLLQLHRIEKYADDGIKVRVSDRDEINRKDKQKNLL